MQKHNAENAKKVQLSQVTPEVDELCNILAQAIERINTKQPVKTKKVAVS